MDRKNLPHHLPNMHHHSNSFYANCGMKFILVLNFQTIIIVIFLCYYIYYLETKEDKSNWCKNICNETNFIPHTTFTFMLQLKASLATILVYELLFGHGLKCGGKFKQCITRNKSSLNAALARIKIRHKVSNNLDLLPKKAITAGRKCS